MIPHSCVLDAEEASPAVELYRGVRDAGKVSTADQIGEEIAALLCDTDVTTFAATEEWHVGHSV